MGLHGETAEKMKKYDRNMGVGEFGMLTSGMGLSFSALRCASPLFRQWVFDRLERGVSPKDIQEEYDELFYGVPRKKKTQNR